MGKRILVTILIVGFFVGVAAAGSKFLLPYNPDEPPQADDTGSTPQGIQSVVQANNQFALDIYSEINKEEENLFYSPYSISAALAMTYEGARGETAKQMETVFHFPTKEILRPNFAAIYNDINENNNAYELKTGNALWVQKDYELLPDFKNTVESYYGGKATNLDFISDTEASRQTINSFIEEQTNNKIKNLIPKGVLNQMTKLVLTNAIYFKGTWEWEFDKDNTREADFKVTPEKTVKTPMMSMDSDKPRFNYASIEDLQIIELPYKGEKISMLILLPKEDLETLEGSLTTENLEQWIDQMSKTDMDAVIIPKFEFETKYFMNEPLKKLGMTAAFDASQADFSGIHGTKDLFITDVIHQAYVMVDEEGTEAAAATAVTVGITAVAPQNIFRADHPFIFLIQDKDTGNILFLGKVVDPTI